MKTRRRNYSSPNIRESEGKSKKELSVKGRNSRKANLTPSVKDHDINIESKRVKKSTQKQIKSGGKEKKIDNSVEAFPSSDKKRNKSVNKRSSMSKKENDITILEKEESAIQDVISETDAHLKFEERENLDGNSTPNLRKRHLRNTVKSCINSNKAGNLKNKNSKKKEITKHHKEEKRISQEDKYIEKSNDNLGMETKLDLPIKKRQKGINQEDNENEESQKDKKNINKISSKKRKNDIENFEKKTESDISIKDDLYGKQENSANELFITQDKSEISSSINKKTKKEENKVKYLDTTNYGRRKINIQGIIIEEIEKYDADKVCMEKKSNSESEASETKETLSKNTKIENTVHASGFNDDQFFIDTTPSLSLLNNTVSESQSKQYDEIENDIQYCHKKMKSHSVFDDDQKTFKNKSNEKHTPAHDKNITNELKKDDNICGKDGVHEFNQKEPDNDNINKSDGDSDSAPEIESFQNSRNKALNSIKNAEDEVRKMKLQTKKLRRKYHERNLMQKEQKIKKILNLEAKKLPQNILDDMATLEKSKYSSKNVEKSLPKKLRLSSENNKEYSNITNDGTQEEFISIHGNTEFMVCRANSFIKKHTSVAESAKNWKRQQLFGNKNRRESVKDMMSKKIKQTFCGKVLRIQS
ncbi:myb-like protein X [Centruroides sculpturatus]|uniref:myb-like protein X n=1 Tax=Centruroides sculpturatus TaxID=218467 RepID=UPI000C6EBB3D|nr:myb-like protein X [Centruroides sculpturatus]